MSPDPTDDARAMVRRYGARKARRDTALHIALLGGIGVGLGALALARRQANRPHAATRSSRGAVEMLASAAQDVSHRVETLAHDAKARVASARSGSLQLAQEPLAVAAVGLAVGLAASAVWPPSETERRLIGPTRRRIIDRVTDVAVDAAEQVRDTVQSTIAAVAPHGGEAEAKAPETPPGQTPPAPRRRKRVAGSPETGLATPSEA